MRFRIGKCSKGIVNANESFECKSSSKIWKFLRSLSHYGIQIVNALLDFVFNSGKKNFFRVKDMKRMPLPITVNFRMWSQLVSIELM